MQLVFHRICTVGPCRIERDPDLGLHPGARLAGRPAPPARSQIKTVAQAIGGPVRAAGRRARADGDAGRAEPVVRRRQLGRRRPDLLGAHRLGRRQRRHLVTRARRRTPAAGPSTVDAPTITGGVGLVVAQDEGSCAAPTTVGDRYTYSVWYRSSAPIQLVGYRRLAAGGYLSFGLSQPFPASPDQWSYATVVTRPMPAGIDRHQHRRRDQDRGQFSFDDFALTDSGPPPAVEPAAAAHRQQHAERRPVGDPDRRPPRTLTARPHARRDGRGWIVLARPARCWPRSPWRSSTGGWPDGGGARSRLADSIVWPCPPGSAPPAPCSSPTPPSRRPTCAICLDERQYVGHDGQRWTTMAELGADTGSCCARRSRTWSASRSSRPSRSGSGRCWCAPSTAT